MNRTYKIIIGIIVVVIVIAGIWYSATQKPAEKGTIKIGAILSFTGPAASYGNWGKNGIELAVEEIKKKYNQKIDLIIEDDNSDSVKAVSAAQKLIQIDKVKVIIMITSSNSFLAVAPIAEQNKIILFTSVSSSPNISQAGDYIFRNRISGLQEADKAADFIINDLKKNKIALFIENTDFGISYGNIFKSTLSNKNEKILAEEKYIQKSTDFRNNIIKIKSFEPEVVYLVCYIDDCINILKQAEELNFRPLWVSTSGIENQKLTNSISESTFDRIYYVSEYYDLNDLIIKEFNKRYETYYKEKSNLYSSNSYDAINIIYEAIEKVGYNPTKIKDWLYQLKDYKGVNGVLSFDSNGDVSKPLMIKTIKNGQFVKYED